MIIQSAIDSILSAVQNETKIIERRDEHLGVLLTMFSPLSFYFNNKLIKRGWAQALIIGDTRTGKTEIAEGVFRFFKQGRVISAENCTMAGLVGGIEQIRNKRFLKWGVMPLMDKRCIALDEISGMSIEDIGQMSGIRSSGVAEINKIITARTNARVRTLWISNPRKNKFLHDYNTAIEAVQELIHAPEDIARFDFAITLKEEDVPLNKINTNYKEEKTGYTKEMGRHHLLFAWSRTADKILLLQETEQEIFRQAILMSKIYSPEIPLIHSAEIRIKLARLAISLANLLFCINEKEDVVVHPELIEYIVKFFTTIYKKSEYDLFSERYMHSDEELDTKDLTTLIQFGKDKFIKFLEYKQIRFKDFEDVLEIDKDACKVVSGLLIRMSLIKKEYTYYRSTKQFIELLKRWKGELESELDNATKDLPF